MAVKTWPELFVTSWIGFGPSVSMTRSSGGEDAEIPGGRQPLFHKSISELKERVRSTRLLFIIKGIPGQEDALEAVLRVLIRIKQEGM